MFELLWSAQELGLALEDITCSSDHLHLRSALNAATADCPVCQLSYAAVHSFYPRTLCDLPVVNLAVHLHLRVRRFFCRTADCPQRVFAEQLGSLARPYAHRATRMAAALRQIGLALGGQAGCRLAADLQLATSPDTILRFVHLTPDEPLLCAPRYLGVDDFCWRRGQTYGTILVDLESGRVIDILPDRQVATFAAWLKQHPGAELICLDRASAYSEGAKLGAPDARQAADRFHLLKNLADALEELLSRLHSELRQSVQQPDSVTPALPAPPSDCADQLIVLTAMPPSTQSATDPSVYNNEGIAGMLTSTETANACSSTAAPEPTQRAKRAPAQQRNAALSQSRRSDRLARYEEVRRLHELGWTQQAIAEAVNLAPKTIGRWLRQDSFPERQDPIERRSKLDCYKAYIRERCEQGCWNAKQIWRELVAQQGYRGGRTQVRDFVAELREEQKSYTAQGSAAGSAVGWQLPSSRELKWLLFKPVDALDGEQYALVCELCRQSKEVSLAYRLITDFQELLRSRRAGELAQ